MPPLLVPHGRTPKRVQWSLLLDDLKVDGNEKRGGSGRRQYSNSASVWHCGDRGLFAV